MDLDLKVEIRTMKKFPGSSRQNIFGYILTYSGREWENILRALNKVDINFCIRSTPMREH